MERDWTGFEFNDFDSHWGVIGRTEMFYPMYGPDYFMWKVRDERGADWRIHVEELEHYAREQFEKSLNPLAAYLTADMVAD